MKRIPGYAKDNKSTLITGRKSMLLKLDEYNKAQKSLALTQKGIIQKQSIQGIKSLRVTGTRASGIFLPMINSNKSESHLPYLTPNAINSSSTQNIGLNNNYNEVGNRKSKQSKLSKQIKQIKQIKESKRNNRESKERRKGKSIAEKSEQRGFPRYIGSKSILLPTRDKLLLSSKNIHKHQKVTQIQSARIHTEHIITTNLRPKMKQYKKMAASLEQVLESPYVHENNKMTFGTLIQPALAKRDSALVFLEEASMGKKNIDEMNKRFMAAPGYLKKKGFNSNVLDTYAKYRTHDGRGGPTISQLKNISK